VMRDNPADSLQTTTMAVREWIGLIAYKFVGRIDSVFPGPEDLSGLVGEDSTVGGGEELSPDENAEQQQGGQGEDQGAYEPPKVAD
jgi:hypothetical protein